MTVDVKQALTACFFSDLDLKQWVEVEWYRKGGVVSMQTRLITG